MKARILVVDDDRLFSNLISQSLVDDFVVDQANDVCRAMQCIDKHCPDLIVLDILMPAANGLGLLYELISFADTALIPIIVCSSVATQLNPELMQISGVRKILDKSKLLPGDIVSYAKDIIFHK